MNENYLWDKSGKDAEIEQLENALLAFRYQETAPPALPAKIIEIKPRRAFGFPRLAFAFGVCATVFAVSIAVWLSNSKHPADGEISANKSAISPSAAPLPSLSKESIIAAKTVETGDKKLVGNLTIQTGIVFKQTVHQTTNAINKPSKIKSVKKPIESPKPTPEFTKDELYAYQQLMTALSITSDKLKIVKDKAEGINNKQ